MNAARLMPGREASVRLVAFAGLAALAASQWARMVADPRAGRVALAVAAIVAGAWVLALIGAAGLRRAPALGLAALATLLTAAAGLVALGVPAELLAPGAWDRLAHHVGRGFAGLDGSVDYPYAGKNEWSRLVLLAGVALALTLAASLAFWPRRDRRGSRTAGLAVLIATCAIAASAIEPGRPLLWGLLLFALVAAWVWLPGLGRRDAVAAVATIAAAGTLAIAAGAALDAERPWIDYSDWELAGNEDGSSFDWNHSYGPLDWPRDGDALLVVESDEPHYWKASVLDDFDGSRWLGSGTSLAGRLELPAQVETGRDDVDREELDQKWVQEVGVELLSLRSEFVVAPGTPLEVDGIEDVTPRSDGTTVVAGDPLADGDVYSALAYVPEPGAKRMRAASGPYPATLASHTEIGLALSEIGETGSVIVEKVDVPPRGSREEPGEARDARRRILDSPYAGVYRLARRITAGEPTAYDAAKAIEEHLRSGRYEYDETIPEAGQYPLSEFLLEDRRGYCQQFSGAMALMLRMVGIPSRVATGFTAGHENPSVKNTFVVTDFDAHSWVEVYLNGIGWVPFEPTPATAPATSQLGEGDFAGGGAGRGGREQPPPPAGGRSGTSAAAPGSGGGGILTAALAGLAILGLGAAIPAAVRARRYRLLSAPEAAEAQLCELDSGLGRLGLPVDPGETLLALEPRLHRRFGPKTASYVAKLRGSRFASGHPVPPSLAERRALRRELRSSRWASAGRLRVALAFPPGGPRRYGRGWFRTSDLSRVKRALSH